ncbi:MAG: hypothetical protein A3E01_00470 [Gammaproteobacteria bacterium RIFCSPHIGHO2_12_FULL_63_22]|nr:MAG: hypothetical protein A3E01_00470 [Gammaproteobacteria bacterium RIFCSPHIGHO2_12_FULL_63_22]
MRPLTGRRLALLSAFAAAPAWAGDDALRYYDVCLNGRCTESVAVLAVAPGQWLVEAQALAGAGIDTRDWPGQQREGLRYIDLLARFPAATLTVDEATQSLAFTLPGNAWSERSYSSARVPSRPQVPVSTIPSVFLNYSFYATSNDSRSAYFDAGWVRGAWLLRSSFDFVSGRLGRRQTSLEFDQPDRQRRWVLGDQALAALDPFGAGGRVAGLGVFRAYELTPGFVTFPGADIRGVMQAPGSVDVYSNGMLVTRQQLEAGPFNLQDLVLAQGSNDLRIVVHDPFAGTYELSGDYYGSARLLRQGLHEFDDRIGWVRQPGRDSEYRPGPPLLSLNHRYGFSDVLTAGIRYEQIGGRRNVGVSVNLRPGVGSLQAALAHSRDDDGQVGTAWRADYSYQGRRMGFGMGMHRRAAGYQSVLQLSDAFSFASLRRERYAQASFALGRRVSVGSRFIEQDYSDGSLRRSLGLNLGWRLGRLRASLGLTRRRGDVTEGDEIFLALNLPLGRDSFSLGASRRDGGNQARFAVQRSAPIDSGWGYRLDVDQGDEGDSIRVGVDHASRIGRSYFTASQFGGQSYADLRFAGGVLWAQGQVFVSQPGASAYALVRTSGMAGVPVLRENARVGVTGEDGAVLVPGMQPYQSNLIGIDASKLDADVRLDEDKAYVSMPRYGVGLVDFQVKTLRAVQAFLATVRDGERQRLGYGEALVGMGDNARSAAIGRDGQVYFDDLAPGVHVLQASSEGASFTCELTVPSAGPMAWLGEIMCVPK